MTTAPYAYRLIAQRFLQDARQYGVRFGDRKVFLATVPGIELSDPECRQLLDELRRMALLQFARADLVAAMDPALVAASEWRLDGAEYHFLVLADDQDWAATAGQPCRWATCPAFGKIVHDPAAHEHYSEIQ